MEIIIILRASYNLVIPLKRTMTELTFVLKLDFQGEIKRLRVMPQTYAELVKIIEETFPVLAATPLMIQYFDTEKDIITVANDADLKEAYLQLKEAKLNTLKLVLRTNQGEQQQKLSQKGESALRMSSENLVEPSLQLPDQAPAGKKRRKHKKHPKDNKKKKEEEEGIKNLTEKFSNVGFDKKHEENEEQKKSSESEEEQKAAVHTHIICDGCQATPIIGIRYKCSVCPDYDLCEKCEAKGIHQHHPFIKMKEPMARPQRHEGNHTDIVIDIPPEAVDAVKNALHSWTQYGCHGMKFPGCPHPCGKEESKEEQKESPCGPCPPWFKYMKCAKRFMKNFHHQKDGNLKKMVQAVGGKVKRTVKLVSQPEKYFVATWILQNNSNQQWPENVYLVKNGGDITFESIPLTNGLKPNETMELTVPIQAPKTPGSYFLVLSFLDSCQMPIGKELRVELDVLEDKDEECDLCYKAGSMEEEGIGSFETCFETLTKTGGNVEAAKEAMKKH